MTSLVMDTTVAMAAVLPERHSEAARQVLLRVADTGAIVPPIWHLEIGNILLAAERRGLLDAARRDEILKHLGGLPISVDEAMAGRAWGAILALARDYGLALHDAAYLELALRRGVMLASFDAALRRAAVVAGAMGAAEG